MIMIHENEKLLEVEYDQVFVSESWQSVLIQFMFAQSINFCSCILRWYCFRERERERERETE